MRFAGITPLFQDKRVRQALVWALDRETVVNNLTHGYATPALDPQPLGSIAYAPDKLKTQYAYQPDTAKQLLDEAGWTAGADGVRAKEGVRLEFEMIGMSGDATVEKMLADFQQKFDAVGVKMTPKQLAVPDLIGLMGSHQFQAMLFPTYWDASGNRGAMFACGAYPNGMNSTNYCNAAYDQLDQQQLIEFDRQKRIAMMIEQANILNEDMPIVPIMNPQLTAGYDSKYHNIRPTAYRPLWWSLPYVWGE